MLHMGFITEVLFGKEVVDRIPALVKEWTAQHDKSKNIEAAEVDEPSKERKIDIKRE